MFSSLRLTPTPPPGNPPGGGVLPSGTGLGAPSSVLADPHDLKAGQVIVDEATDAGHHVARWLTPEQEIADLSGEPEQPEQVAGQIRDQVAFVGQQPDLADERADLLAGGDRVLLDQPGRPTSAAA
jgi:hypothetical protein